MEPVTHPRTAIVIPLLIIALGVGWLLNAMEYLPKVDWIWTLGLGAVGVVTLAVGKRLTRDRFVVGVWLVVASVLSVLRQREKLEFKYELPILVILIGVLLLIAHFIGLPRPDWAEAASRAGSGSGDPTSSRQN